MAYPKIASFRTPVQFLAHLETLDLDLPFEEQIESAPISPLAQPIRASGLEIGNRFCVLPMEGWDCQPDGKPSELTLRRWQRFGMSGAKLIWGGEAAAVRPDGRANPNQLIINAETLPEVAGLRRALVDMHVAAHGSSTGLVIGLQLTHSGRYARPKYKTHLESCLAYDHPLLNPRVGLPVPSGLVISDDEMDALVEDFIQAAVLAQEAGFDFVDIKHCHGYLLHEFLSAVQRPGRYGGSLENRARVVREIILGIQRRAAGLRIGVRLSAFDMIPFQGGAGVTGQPAAWEGRYPYAFGGDGSGQGIDLSEPAAFLGMLSSLGVELVCITAGSPYYNPHIQRPATFPPSDGYLPPEDPLVGVCAPGGSYRGTQSPVSQDGFRRFGIFLPAGIPAQRGAGRGSGGKGRPGWSGTLHPGLPRASLRCARRSPFAAEKALPNFQRLHYRSAQRDGFRLLPAGRILQNPAGRSASD